VEQKKKSSAPVSQLSENVLIALMMGKMQGERVAVSGTCCGGIVRSSFAAKMGTCMECDFFKVIQKEEGTKMVGAKIILERLK
jgi:hypothetical protein